jgi:hypothetical protein
MNIVAISAITLCAALGQLDIDRSESKTDAEPAQVTIRSFTYKNEPRRTLAIYYPDIWKAADERPVLVIFRCQIPVQREHFRSAGHGDR